MDEKYNPWDVPDLDVYLVYSCPECYSNHPTKVAFVDHALLDHPLTSEILKNNQVKQETIENMTFDDFPDQYDEVPDIKIEQRPKRTKSHDKNYSVDEAFEDLDEEIEYGEPEEIPDVVKPKKAKIPESHEPKFKCEYCGKNLYDKYNLKKHLEEEHDEDFAPNGKSKLNAKCTKCEKATFVNKYLLLQHRRICVSYQTCDICNETFDGYDTLRKHFKKSHPKDDRYIAASNQKQTCEICGKVLSNPQRLKQHMMTAHGLGEVLPEQCVRECSKCHNKFQTANEMNDHFRTTCLDSVSENKIDFKCKFCDVRWISHLSLELHLMESHQKIMFACDQCDHVTFSKNALTDHNDTQHLQIKKHVCHHCGKSYSSKLSMRKHFSSVHREGSPIKAKYKCDYCGKCYKLLNSLKAHVASNHERKIQYQCEYCSSTFWVKDYLKTHIRHVHQKYRPNKCELCGDAFLTKRDLNKHKEKHGVMH